MPVDATDHDRVKLTVMILLQCLKLSQARPDAWK